MSNDLNNRPKIVVIGGGTGLPVILKSLKEKNVDITAIVTVADDGGSSGKIRNYMDVVPPGDIRNVLVSLSELPKLELDLFQYRFNNGDEFLSGHSIGNLIIAALTEMKDGVNNAVEIISNMMKVNGHVYPASSQDLQLCAEFYDGTKMAGEYEITYANKNIKRVWVENISSNEQPKTNQKVIDAIMNADQIVLGPGSLFTSILPNLMIENLGHAVIASPAKVVYICNIMTQKGETDHFTDADHVKVLNRHLGCNFINVVLVNNASIPNNYIDKIKWNEISKQVTHDEAGLEQQHCKVIQDNFLKLSDDCAFHNGKLVSDTLIKLINNKDWSD
ncbi:gluconeogenesis factor YvcK family protein [Apilactobacillus timberlakei]|uniref:Putative gluconeogenesis factor n=1 Tax=Apilactobacillus timberlakei TaxID=2008380 RepID=A0ABY2YW60_9LACO|nr:YvcK family protein [Apilactobacillus timberlakei]TPR12569.1 YvcK family protein [Apilactobacillus timberlakei]TPR13400.1 YvcK family protein [Apilactobacillus timberlakei]TPR15473.1 YvcK family protein [Apilactobacillus timberlakei]